METARMDLIPSTVITQICGRRDEALARMREAVSHMQRGHEVALQALDSAALAHHGAVFYLEDRREQSAYQRLFAEIDPAVSLDTYRKHLDACVWMHLVAVTGMEKMMDRTAFEELRKTLCEDVPEVTEDNVRATLEGLACDARLIFQRGLARAFIELDSRFRSHDAFKLDARIILTNVFDSWGSWSHHAGMRDTVRDVERVFAVLDGKEPDGHGLIQAVTDSRGGGFSARQGYVETAYFRIRTFKNGNAHLWFTRPDLVERANQELAAYYGDVLPDAVPDDVPNDVVMTTTISKDLAFYPTPTRVVRRMLDQLGIQKGDLVLEPSAGTGHIVRELLARGATVRAIEVDAGRVAALRGIPSMAIDVQQANFLQVYAVPRYKYVVMNPPFSGTHWMSHVRHAYDFLAPGGVLVSVLPVSVVFGETKAHEAFRKWVEPRRWRRGFDHLPQESFAESGTRINTVLLTLVKR